MKSAAASLLLLVFIPATCADIVVSRTVDSVAPAIGSGTVKLESGCSATDQYGSNNCDLDWGSSYKLDLDVTLKEDITAGSTFSVDMKVDSIVPFKFTCPLCGDKCSFVIPVIKRTVTFQMPPCPLKAGHYTNSTSFQLPKDPLPIKVGATGTAEAKDAAGNQLAHVTVTAGVKMVEAPVELSLLATELEVQPEWSVGRWFEALWDEKDGHYEDPKAGCSTDEKAIQVQGVAGDFCAPKCSAGGTCPAAPTGVTAKPQCALQTTTGDKYCALICQPSIADDQCGENASCKTIQGVGICTYDD